jgi:hypothetical protein
MHHQWKDGQWTEVPAWKEKYPEVREKLAEMDFLERSIGKTGMLAIHPFLTAGARNRWQLELLGSGG